MQKTIFGAHLRPLRDLHTFTDVENATMQAFFRALDIGGLVAIAGAGMSADFGYPLWHGLAKKIVEQIIRDQITEIEEKGNGPEIDIRKSDNSQFQRIESVEKNFLLDAKEILDKEGPTTAQLTSILDYCHRIYFRRDQNKTFDSIVRKALGNGNDRDPNIEYGIDALIRRLGIRRFATTNYDDEIKSALAPVLEREGYVGSKDIAKSTDARCPTISRLTSPYSDLVSFSMGVGDYLAGVVYLHGRNASGKGASQEESKFVLTETQYQREYMSDQLAARDRRDAYRLLFLSNSLLFTGTALEDDDVLRPLRQFVADNDIASWHRPWFCLRYLQEGEHELEIFHRLYYRYGIRTIFVKPASGNSVREAIVGKIKYIQEQYRSYRDSQSLEVTVRLPHVRRIIPEAEDQEVSHRVSVHHATVFDKHLDKLNEEQIEWVNDQFAVRPRCKFILAPAGYGKGLAGYKLAQFKRPGFRTVGFFATMHFANEFLSVIDGARQHLIDAGTKLAPGWRVPEIRDKSVVEHFFDILEKAETDCYFVFGGIERLLRPLPYDPQSHESINRWFDTQYTLSKQSASSGEHESRDLPDAALRLRWGRPANIEILDFLKRAVEFGGRLDRGEVQRRIVLTSSIIPESLIGIAADIASAEKWDTQLRNMPGRSARLRRFPTEEKRQTNSGGRHTTDHVKAQDGRRQENTESGGIWSDVPSFVVMPIARLIGKVDVVSFVNPKPKNPEQSAIRDLDSAISETLKRIEKSLSSSHYAADVFRHTVRWIFKSFPVSDDDRISLLNELMMKTESLQDHLRPSELPSALVAKLIDFHEKFDKSNEWMVFRIVLETLSLFTTPIEIAVLLEALKAQKVGVERAGKALEVLLQCNLVLQFRPTSGSQSRYTTHTLVRRAMLRKHGAAEDSPAEIQQFDLNDFASEPADVQPLTLEATERTLRIFDALIYIAESSDDGRREKSELVEKRPWVRAAYGVLRAGWSATGLGRLLSQEISVGSPGAIYVQYHRRLSRLLTAIYADEEDQKRSEEISGNSKVRQQSIRNSSRGAFLYPDELAWIYNELGLVSYCEGEILDAQTYFRLGSRLNKRIEEHKNGYRLIESKINMAAVLIDSAYLGKAKDCLTQAATFAAAIDGDAVELTARIHGHLGLVAHLSGDGVRAEQLYLNAIEELHNFESWRGVSVFSRHLADLYRSNKDFDGAAERLRSAIAAAETGFHPDLLHYCRVSEANLARAKDPTHSTKAMSVAVLEPTLRFAQNIGSAKLESDVYRIMGLIEVDQRDFDAATRSTLHCLWISRACGLRLRMMSSLQLLGELLRKRGDLANAKGVLVSVAKLGQSFEYPAPMEFAEKTLAEMGYPRSSARGDAEIY